VYRPVNIIEVRAWGSTVGAVTLDPGLGFYVFEYDRGWQARGIEPAPLTMPLKQAVHVFPLLPENTFMRLPAMLADSIPDDFGNALIDAYLSSKGVGKNSITPLDRLAYMGKRGTGALEFRPVRGPRHTKPTAVAIGELVSASRTALRGTIGDDRETEAAIMNLIRVGTSAGGARAKAVVAWNPATGQIRSGQLPADEGFEQWIIKLDGVADDHLTAPGNTCGRIEYAYSLMAKAAGISMTECRLLEENGRAHFMTRRFDRQNGEKLHLQSLCAMRHLDYRLHSTHDYSQYFQTVNALELQAPALEEAFRRMVFNVLAANCDDHTKNLSFVMDKTGRWTLAPAYDMTHAFNPDGKWTFQHLMSINRKFRDIARNDLEAVGDRFMVRDYKSIIRAVAGSVRRWLEFADAAGLAEQTALRVEKDFSTVPDALRNP